MNILFERADALGALLKARKETVSVAESSAGGLVSAALLSVPGASAYFAGGSVIYTQDARRKLLGVSEEISTMRGANEEFALILAKKARERLSSTWGICETGATGPRGNRYGDAAGHVCIAVAGPTNAVMTLETGSAEREENMWEFAQAALDFLRATIEG